MCVVFLQGKYSYMISCMCVFRHDKVLEGITVCGEMREQERFTPIVQGVVMDDPNMKVHCVDCIHEQTFIAVCN